MNPLINAGLLMQPCPLHRISTFFLLSFINAFNLSKVYTAFIGTQHSHDFMQKDHTKNPESLSKVSWSVRHHRSLLPLAGEGWGRPQRAWKVEFGLHNGIQAFQEENSKQVCTGGRQQVGVCREPTLHAYSQGSIWVPGMSAQTAFCRLFQSLEHRGPQNYWKSLERHKCLASSKTRESGSLTEACLGFYVEWSF